MKKFLIILPILVFIIGIISGFFIDNNLLLLPNDGTSVEVSFIQLFLHNLKAVLSNAAGIISFGITTSINIFMTAFLLGMNIRVAKEAGFDALFILRHTLPHFTEYIAIFISGYIGYSGFELIFSHKITKSYFYSKIKLLFITIPLLLIAAYMEVKIVSH